MKRFSLDEPEHFVDEYIPPKMKEDPQGDWVKHSEFEKVVNDLKNDVLKHREAYGLDIFPNSETIDENSSRDSIAAKMGRHMCDVFTLRIDEILKAEGGDEI